LAFIVFSIQIFGPLVVIIQLWSGDQNPFNNPQKLWNHLTLQHTFCSSKDRTAMLTTLIGTLFVIVVNMMIFRHCSDECEDAEKMSRLPADTTWTILGNIAQAVCSCSVIIAAPIELWTETGVTGIMMNSMALLFVYSLDDIAGDIFSYIGEDDKEFKKQVAWNYALLAYCPVDIRDVINPNATGEDDFWKISYNAEGSLLSNKLEVCETRIMTTEQETSALLKDKKRHKFEDVTVLYRMGPGSWPQTLPGYREHFIRYLWYVTKHFVHVLGLILPFVWFVCDKPC
jgi:ribosomal protein L24E